jgi:Tfp pilus assembly protein PilF
MVRYAPRDEKLGKKIWIWGLSRQGMIWEQLLTDSDGQYAEVQSGRLFNQATELSTATPFKHRGFAPHVADRWTEYWYPVTGTKGIVAASRVGALNVVPNGNAITVTFSPTQQISDTLRVMSGSKTLYQAPVVRRPLELFSATIPVGGARTDSLRIVLGEDLLEYVAAPGAGALARPLDSPATFDWSSAYGLQLQGKEWIRQREYAKAVVALDSALAKDPYYVPALADRAMLAIRSGEYESARQYAITALSIDTYDPAANYYYGLANRRQGRLADARDGFEVAASSPEMRGAAWTELARMSLAAGRLSAARAYAEKALGTEPGNLDALGVEISVARQSGDGEERLRLLQRVEAVDPLSHHARLERLLATGGETLGADLLRGVRAELPEQVLLELATWYVDVGETDIARRVLEGLGDNPEAMYWRASLPGTADAETLIARANRVSPRFVLPFRAETMPALQAAARASTHWAPRYYLALTLLALGRHREADSLLLALGDEPDFAPFYAVRASVPGRSASDARHDLERAAALDGSEWRYGKLLVDRALQAGDTTHALAVARRSRARFASNDIVRLMFDRMLVAAGEFVEADRELQRLDILPQEGANEVHALYRQSKLVLAVDAISARKWKAAASLVSAAREWPERLGEGKPYDADVDERLEDWLDAAIMDGSGRHAEALQRWNRLAVNARKTATASDVLPLWALERLGRGAEAAESLREWSRDRLTRGADGRVLERWLARFGGSMQSPGTKGRR